MERDSILEAFGDGGVFGGLPANAAMIFRQLGSEHRLRDGDRLYARGESSHSVYGVLSGRIRVSNLAALGRDVVAAAFEPGDWIGEASIFDGLPRTHDAHAAAEASLFVMPRLKVAGVLKTDPDLCGFFARRLANTLRQAYSSVEAGETHTLTLRLAKLVIDLGRAYGQPIAEGLMIDLQLPQLDLARMLSTSRHTVNKELRRWKSKGLIDLRYGKLVIHEPRALQRLVDATQVLQEPAAGAAVPPSGGYGG